MSKLEMSKQQFLEEKFSNFQKFIDNEIIQKYEFDESTDSDLNLILQTSSIKFVTYFAQSIMPKYKNNYETYIFKLFTDYKINPSTVDKSTIDKTKRYLDCFTDIIASCG